MVHIGSRLILIISFSLAHAKIPDYIYVCNSKDPNISKCIINSINQLKPKLRNGIPELDVPSMEPLLLETIVLKNGVHANVTNLKVSGASNFELLDIKANIPKNKFMFKIVIPKLEFVGNYDLDMKFLFINIKGKGPIYGNFSKYHLEGLMLGRKIIKGGNEYLKFEKMLVRVRMERASLRLENLFNGDPILGEAANALINENSNVFVNEIKPNLEKSLGDKLTEIANKITLKFTYKELFL